MHYRLFVPVKARSVDLGGAYEHMLLKYAYADAWQCIPRMAVFHNL